MCKSDKAIDDARHAVRVRNLSLVLILAGSVLMSVHASQLHNRADAPLCRVDHVTDGDTVDVTCDGTERTLRLNCIDAPETDQNPWGERATRALGEGIGDQVRVNAHDQDQYGRTIATVYTADGQHDLNLAMVRAGHAAVYDRFCDWGEYQQAEQKARNDDRGIWSQSGPHQRPWQYRANQR